MAAISHRALGTQGLSVSTIGLGCMSLSGVYGPADDAESEKLIRYAVDRGIDHLDSSDMYGWGHNEEVLGRAIKGLRNRVVLVTKFGQTRREGQANGVDGSPRYVQQACEASLKRLRADMIDFYYQHRVDPSVKIEDTVGAMAGLVRQGKVRFLGLSEARPETIRRAHKVHPNGHRTGRRGRRPALPRSGHEGGLRLTLVQVPDLCQPSDWAIFSLD
jgi:aryl-alcohol dehydrogenase-like predicted oxidoreductase